MREAQAYLTKKLRERDLGRDLEGAKITLMEYLDRWIQAAVKPRVRAKTCDDYEGTLRRYIRPNPGDRIPAAMRPLDLQATLGLIRAADSSLEPLLAIFSYGSAPAVGKTDELACVIATARVRGAFLFRNDRVSIAYTNSEMLMNTRPPLRFPVHLLIAPIAYDPTKPP